MIETRPDIAFATLVKSCSVKNPSYIYIKTVKIIAKYLKVTKNQKVVYRQNTLIIEEYLDSDWTRNKNSKNSTSSYIFILNSTSVSWCSKRQFIMTLLLI